MEEGSGKRSREVNNADDKKPYPGPVRPARPALWLALA